MLIPYETLPNVFLLEIYILTMQLNFDVVRQARLSFSKAT